MLELSRPAETESTTPAVLSRKKRYDRRVRKTVHGASSPGVVALAFGAAALAGACSLAFPAGDLDAGTSGAGAGGAATSAHTTTSTHTTTSSNGPGTVGSSGASTSSGGAGGGCSTDGECDDGDPCTADDCHLGSCRHQIQAGSACGVGTDCTPASTCNAAGACVPGQPSDAACNDGNSCTIDHCDVTGCTHTPSNGQMCNDGDACDGPGTCNAAGQCVASAVVEQTLCTGTFACPGGFYASDYFCDTNSFCGGCPLCVNSYHCKYACEPSFDACCDIGDGTNCPCPAGWHANGPSHANPTCGCGSGPAVTCVH
jgi:hypothetical protein